MKKIALAGLVAAITLPLLFTGCDKNETSSLMLHLHPKVGSEVFAFNQDYTINGTTVQFTLAQFYLYGFTLQGADADQTIDKYYLVNAGQMMYDAGEINSGEFTGFTFNIGVDSVTNGQTEENFTSRPADDPLAQQDPAMHWNWNTGYIFAKLEGMIDTDGDNVVDAVWQRHIGKNEMHRMVNIAISTPIEVIGDTYSLNFDLDYGNFIKDEDLINTPFIHGMSPSMMDNMASSFNLQ